MRILTADECVALLSTVYLGRLALTERALPIILPVTFACLDGDIVFNVAAGVLLRAAETGHVVCFEADSAGGGRSMSWSVYTIGPLSVVEGQASRELVQHLDLGRWSHSSTTSVRLTPHVFSGRSGNAVMADATR
jgi:nitroimidazol reductase NimA-like FMN-containing flavoprotein (pyridoxamine 5'-phosphate oxidase superfamily)